MEMTEEINTICNVLKMYTFIDVPSKLVNYYEGETILKDNIEIGGIYKSDNEDGNIFIHNIEVIKGNGANVLAKLFCDLNINAIFGESVEDVFDFWRKFGAVYGGRSSDRKINFMIPKNKFFIEYIKYIKENR